MAPSSGKVDLVRAGDPHLPARDLHQPLRFTRHRPNLPDRCRRGGAIGSVRGAAEPAPDLLGRQGDDGDQQPAVLGQADVDVGQGDGQGHGQEEPGRPQLPGAPRWLVLAGEEPPVPGEQVGGLRGQAGRQQIEGEDLDGQRIVRILAQEVAGEGHEGDGQEEGKVPPGQALSVSGDVPEHPVMAQPELTDHIERDQVAGELRRAGAEFVPERQGRIVMPGRQGGKLELENQQGEGDGHHAVGQGEQAVHSRQFVGDFTFVGPGRGRCRRHRVQLPRRSVANRRSTPTDSPPPGRRALCRPAGGFLYSGW